MGKKQTDVGITVTDREGLLCSARVTYTKRNGARVELQPALGANTLAIGAMFLCLAHTAMDASDVPSTLDVATMQVIEMVDALLEARHARNEKRHPSPGGDGASVQPSQDKDNSETPF